MVQRSTDGAIDLHCRCTESTLMGVIEQQDAWNIKENECEEREREREKERERKREKVGMMEGDMVGLRQGMISIG